MTDALFALRKALEQRSEPRAEAVGELLDHLEHRFGRVGTTPVNLRDEQPLGDAGFGRPAPRGGLRPRLAIAVAAVVALVVGAVLVDDLRRPKPVSALSVLEEARERIGSLPAFTAEVFKRQPLDDLQNTGLEAVELAYRLEYWDAARWRTTVLSNSFEAEPVEIRSAWPERAGDFNVADGELLGMYQSKANRMLVSPLAEHGDDVEFLSSVGLVTQLEDYPDLDAALETGECTVGSTTFLGRAAKVVTCRSLGRLWNGEMVLDAETGLLLRMTHDADDYGNRDPGRALLEVRALDLSPEFGSDVFDVTGPPGSTAAWVGSAPPPAEYTVRPSDAVTSVIAVPGSRAIWLAPDGDDVWVLTRDASPDDCPCGGRPRLSRIDVRTHDVVPTAIEVPDDVVGFAAVGGTAWTGARDIVELGSAAGPEHNRTTIHSFVAATGQRRHEPIVTDWSGPTAEVITAAGFLWSTGGPSVPVDISGVDSAANTTLQRIDPATGRVVQEIAFAGMYAGGLTTDGDRVWVVSTEIDPRDVRRQINSIVGFDADTGDQVARVRIAGAAYDLVAKGGDVWALVPSPEEQGQATLVRIDSATGSELARAEIGMSPGSVVLASGSLWITERQDGTLSRYDPVTLDQRGAITVGGQPGDVVFAHGALWVADLQAPRILRVNL